ncbi:hypothetical protein PG996_011120 [Apiospora saccharicola]|uniref:Uncharacterized protein n=1 Tax=Apiospora saccharicola TaxID=335842 RepID=A0ABR1UGY1_9PEZI
MVVSLASPPGLMRLFFTWDRDDSLGCLFTRRGPAPPSVLQLRPLQDETGSEAPIDTENDRREESNQNWPYLGLPGIGAYIVENDIERIQDARVSAKQAPVLGGHAVHAANVVNNAHQGVALRLVARRVVVRLPVAKERVQTLDESLVLVNPGALLGPVALQGIVQGGDKHRLHHRGIDGRLGGP